MEAAGREKVFAIGLGSNLGDGRATLGWALDRLEALLGPLRRASLYRSVHVGDPPAEGMTIPDYLNTVALLPFDPPSGETPPIAKMKPEEVLAVLLDLEGQAGRRRQPDERHAPRTLDLDLLLFGDLCQDLPELTLPHPRLRQRRFVLAPLAELAPDLELPPDGNSVARALAELGTEQEVERLGDEPSDGPAEEPAAGYESR